MTPPICIDANIVIHLLISPDHPVHTLWEIWDREDVELIAPTLLLFEVTNVLYRYQRQGYLSLTTTQSVLSAALSLPIHISADSDLHLAALVIAADLKLPAAYDAHYLALAQQNSSVLWTTDQRLAKLCPPGWVKLVE